MPATIEIRNVTVQYSNGVTALSGLNLTVETGEFVFLVGPTGHGKSTLLKLLYGDEKPTSGEVLVFGWEVPRMSTGRISHLRRRIGVVFQDFRLLPRTAAENVTFALQATGYTGRDLPARVIEALNAVGLASKAQDSPSQLSAGEQQSLAVARMLATHPALILADEPTGNLDPDSSAHIMSLLARANAEGATVLVATHDPAIVNAMQRRVIALRQGAVFRDVPQGGYPEELERD